MTKQDFLSFRWFFLGSQRLPCASSYSLLCLTNLNLLNNMRRYIVSRLSVLLAESLCAAANPFFRWKDGPDFPGLASDLLSKICPTSRTWVVSGLWCKNRRKPPPPPFFFLLFLSRFFHTLFVPCVQTGPSNFESSELTDLYVGERFLCVLS